MAARSTSNVSAIRSFRFNPLGSFGGGWCQCALLLAVGSWEHLYTEIFILCVDAGVYCLRVAFCASIGSSRLGSNSFTPRLVLLSCAHDGVLLAYIGGRPSWTRAGLYG